ncbi:efflux RND transporter permease subunit, partial [Enterobacter hormaechei]
EGASRRFRAVMMTAVSFIIGVLALMLGPGGGAPRRRIIGTNVFTGIVVGTVVGIFLITAHLVLLSHKKKRTSPTNNPCL